jgi:WD40 repeat protein
MKEFKNINFDEIIVITCRHIDYSFKIHYLNKTSIDKKIKKKNSIKNKIYSFICEDFVTSCCCISSNTFIIGLNNGKLIYYIIKQNPTFLKIKKSIEQKNNIIIEKKMYIQAHKGKINSIDIDKRLGIVITTGDDNYIFIRKLYDFELLLPIKIKNKYRILMLKTSSFNFLYLLCLNKINNKKIIFGYTLSGMKFAKSAYDSYDNISINEDGDIITMDESKNMILLSENIL